MNLSSELIAVLSDLIAETDYIDRWGRCRYCDSLQSEDHAELCEWNAADELLKKLRNVEDRS